MAWPYKKRSADWNYGGKNFKLSRSKIELFQKCERCFYIDNKLGIARPKTPPFNLNKAVDTLLKKEFDLHRKQQTPHPLMEAYGVDAKPFAHKDLDEWRENFKGIQYFHPLTALFVTGAIDDVWIDAKGELIVVDYKATAKDGEISMDDEWKGQYKRQLEIYQWLLRQKGFKVSDVGYFVYANGQADKEAFDGKLEFQVELKPYAGRADWVDGVIVEIKKCLVSAKVPSPSPDCDYCCYINEAAALLSPKRPAAKKAAEKAEQSSLF